MARRGSTQNRIAFTSIVAVSISATTGCTTTSPVHAEKHKAASVAEPIESAPVAAAEPAAASIAPVAPVATATPGPAPTPVVSPDCKAIPGFANDEPVFVKSAGVVLTRVASPCDLADGSKGHLISGGWMAMGFPCTGAEGRIDWKGTNYGLPKMVSFLLDTSCPMSPNDPNRLKNLVTTEVGVSGTAPLIAFNPFVVQYWEIPGFDDADASFAVELRNNKSLQHAWAQQLLKQKPLKVFLVGRENAWVPGNHMYAVDAELRQVSKNRFTMRVISARVLKGDELTAVKARCEALRPERECGKVF